jgi:effector-binding domain-containing protein
MLKIEAVATVYYTCTLTDEDEKKVREYAEENNMSLGESAEELYFNDEINVYDGDVVESEVSTQSISESEFNKDEE